MFDLPRCFGRGRTEEEATSNLPDRIAAHLDWLGTHGEEVSDARVEFDVTERYTPPKEQLEGSLTEDVYVVNAFFDDDARPLASEEVEAAVRLLSRSRTELTKALEVRPLDKVAPILDHIGWAEWWYWDRLEAAFPREQVPDDPIEKLERTRRHTIENLPSLVGRAGVSEKRGELWSPRKLLRRTLWHEADHTEQIAAET